MRKSLQGASVAESPVPPAASLRSHAHRPLASAPSHLPTSITGAAGARSVLTCGSSALAPPRDLPFRPAPSHVLLGLRDVTARAAFQHWKGGGATLRSTTEESA